MGARTKIPAPEVKVGQVWADNDYRAEGRTLEVVSINTSVHEPYVVCTVLTKSHQAVTGGVGQQVNVRLSRMRPTSTGYRLIRDVS